MDRIDLPSEEVAEQMAEDCLDMIGKAIAARDAEWVAAVDALVNRRKEEQKNHLLDALMCTHYGAGADALRELKARMTGEK